MYFGKTLFSQVMEFVPWTSLARILQRHGGGSGVRALPCTEHFRAMAFAQITWRESQRDIEASPSANAGKLYAMGFRSAVRIASGRRLLRPRAGSPNDARRVYSAASDGSASALGCGRVRRFIRSLHGFRTGAADSRLQHRTRQHGGLGRTAGELPLGRDETLPIAPLCCMPRVCKVEARLVSLQRLLGEHGVQRIGVLQRQQVAKAGCDERHVHFATAAQHPLALQQHRRRHRAGFGRHQLLGRMLLLRIVTNDQAKQDLGFERGHQRAGLRVAPAFSGGAGTGASSAASRSTAAFIWVRLTAGP